MSTPRARRLVEHASLSRAHVEKRRGRCRAISHWSRRRFAITGAASDESYQDKLPFRAGREGQPRRHFRPAEDMRMTMLGQLSRR